MDFCILCGCDYNVKIKNIACERSYKLIKKFNNLENIEENTRLDLTTLNYNRIREIFNIDKDLIYDII